MTEFHQLDDAQLAALASGFGGTSVMAELISSQQSRHMLLLKYVLDRWPDTLPGRDDAITVLDRVQRHHPHIFNELLQDPLVGAWLATTTRRLDLQGPGGASLTGDFLHLGGLAASALLHAGTDGELVGYAHRGRVTLPGAGEVILDTPADTRVTVTVADGKATVSAGGRQVSVPSGDHCWRELRRLTGGRTTGDMSVRVEDGNPYRARYHAPPSERLTATEAARWQALFAEAWELIAQYAPERATELAVGLRALVPLADEGDGSARSGTARDAVGAVGLSPPRTAPDLAVTLIHEFQHSKLSSALGLVALHNDRSTERHFAPWRKDGRPTPGLFQGVYAFLGIADLWHRFRSVPGWEAVAELEFAKARIMVDQGVKALERSRELTAQGSRFVARMRTALDALLVEPLAARAVTEAHSFLNERRTTWEADNPGLSSGTG